MYTIEDLLDKFNLDLDLSIALLSLKIDGEFEEYIKGLDNTQSFSDALDVETYHF